jgi:hypothetical protein
MSKPRSKPLPRVTVIELQPADLGRRVMLHDVYFDLFDEAASHTVSGILRGVAIGGEQVKAALGVKPSVVLQLDIGHDKPARVLAYPTTVVDLGPSTDSITCIHVNAGGYPSAIASAVR